MAHTLSTAGETAPGVTINPSDEIGKAERKIIKKHLKKVPDRSAPLHKCVSEIGALNAIKDHKNETLALEYINWGQQFIPKRSARLYRVFRAQEE